MFVGVVCSTENYNNWWLGGGVLNVSAASVIYDAHCISSESPFALSDVQRLTPMSHRVRRVPMAQQENPAPKAPR